jgi:hypothetical protein
MRVTHGLTDRHRHRHRQIPIARSSERASAAATAARACVRKGGSETVMMRATRSDDAHVRACARA